MTTSVIKKPWITEKSARLNENGSYVFIVTNSATKSEIKKAIKLIYKVDVAKVNITTKPDRIKGLGSRATRKAGHKKAVVILKSGQKIDII